MRISLNCLVRKLAFDGFFLAHGSSGPSIHKQQLLHWLWWGLVGADQHPSIALQRRSIRMMAEIICHEQWCLLLGLGVGCDLLHSASRHFHPIPFHSPQNLRYPTATGKQCSIQYWRRVPQYPPQNHLQRRFCVVQVALVSQNDQQAPEWHGLGIMHDWHSHVDSACFIKRGPMEFHKYYSNICTYVRIYTILYNMYIHCEPSMSNLSESSINQVANHIHSPGRPLITTEPTLAFWSLIISDPPRYCSIGNNISLKFHLFYLKELVHPVHAAESLSVWCFVSKWFQPRKFLVTKCTPVLPLSFLPIMPRQSATLRMHWWLNCRKSRPPAPAAAQLVSHQVWANRSVAPFFNADIEVMPFFAW